MFFASSIVGPEPFSISVERRAAWSLRKTRFGPWSRLPNSTIWPVVLRLCKMLMTSSRNAALRLPAWSKFAPVRLLQTKVR